MDLTTDIELLKGVGSITAEKLGLGGIKTVEDLIYFLPRDYSDFSNILKIAEVKPGLVSLKVVPESVSGRYVRRRFHVTEAILKDDTGKLRAVWFNQPYRIKQLTTNKEFFVSGNYGFERNRYILLNPSAELVSDMPVQTGRVVPIYRVIRGLKPHITRKIMANLRPLIKMLPETLPNELLKRHKLIPLSEALETLHFPSKIENIDQAKRRLAFEELLVLQLAALKNKQENAALDAWKIKFNEPKAKSFVNSLPFKLTDAQRLSAWEIVKNFEAGQPMNRLLQGDVGAGKTVVAALAAFLAADAGYQTAIMAPTEILATQHAATLQNLLEPHHATVGLLTSGVKAAAKKTLLGQIKNGAVAVTVGTHALIQPSVEFKKLGFVVIDEQHRFGVAQRQELLKKSKKMPHLLAMTATPIPRSLMLTVYGELDVSIINQKPKNRLPIITKIHSPNSRAQLYAQVEAELKKGRQAYVICPIITASGEVNELKSVEEEFKRLKQSQFKSKKIGLLHGKLKPTEKEAVMSDFAARKTDILVSTTVVEVGVDVPNASVMIIEGAERFGLAQLHQLRGRVGRAEHQSYCFLVPTTSQAPTARLRELEQSNDGFYLAERDLEIRGPGEIYGRMQHGVLNLKVARLGDTELTAESKKAALQILKSDPNLLQLQTLATKVAAARQITTLN